MRKWLIVLALLLLFFTESNSEASTNDNASFIDQLQNGLTEIKENVDIEEIKGHFNTFFQFISSLIEPFLTDDNGIDSDEQVKQLDLDTPSEQTFSVANIEIGQTKEEVEATFGQAQRISYNEYGTNWYTHHENYQNFFMVAYNENEQVVVLFTNQNLLSSSNGIELGTSKDDVLAIMGDPLTSIQKGLVSYQLPDDREYDIFTKDNSYVTIFYDQHEDNTVTAIQIISESLEEAKKEMYTEESSTLMEGFEYQLFDLTNAERVKHGLSVLTWDEDVRATARQHSEDMAENNYFSHTNLAGESPFDRMEDDGITFLLAGENLAYGQFSSIFAHEGLLNSLGHRENMLKSDYEYLGVGVAFNNESQPYYTENFYAK